MERDEESLDTSGRAPERRLHHRVMSGASAWLVTESERHDAECVNVSMGGAAVIRSRANRAGARFPSACGI